MPVYTLRSPMPVTAKALHDWHARPGAFARLTPPWERVELIGEQGDFGARRVELRMHRGPIPMRWVAQHRDHVPGEQFVDEQVEGPFRRWVHTHRFLPNAAGGSFLEDEVEWEGSLASLGAAFSGGVDATLARTFAFRHARTRADLERHARWSQRALTIALAGARGLVGEHLLPLLTTGGHTVRRLVRGRPGPGDIPWDPARGELDPAALEDVDVFVHLSGESISGRWTEERKREIVRSRVESTTLVARTLATLPRRPALVCASAIGIYGDRGEERLTEGSRPGVGFLPEVCTAWEAACAPARLAGLRVANLRIGVVLSHAGGALAQLLPPFRAGVGGIVGSGAQFFSWISLEDLLWMILWAAASDVAGPINATAPNPVTNAAFTAALGTALGRPTVLPLPAFAVKLAFGEMGERLLLEGARVYPTVAEASGFPFLHPTLDLALAAELGA